MLPSTTGVAGSPAAVGFVVPFVLILFDFDHEVTVHALRHDPGFVLTQSAVFRVEGPGALDCLQGVLTCDVAGPGTGSVQYGAMLTSKGMIIADFHVMRDDAGYTLITSLGARDAALGLFRRQFPPRLAKVTDRSGPMDRAGTRYTVWFGPVKSATEILEVERPRRFRTRFGSWILRGESGAVFEPVGDGTRITQEFHTIGAISAISSWVFSRGSYEGSFQGELNKFARLAEREVRGSDRQDAP